MRAALFLIYLYQPVTQFATAAKQFEKKLARLDFGEPQSEAACQVFGDLAEAFARTSLASAKPSNRALIDTLDFERQEVCFTKGATRRQLRTKTKWKNAAEAAGRSELAGERAFDAINEHYESCHEGLEKLLSAIAAELLARLYDDMQELMQGWYTYKRNAALLDFDDLLYTARDLLAGHEEVRKALTKRYKHVLVDEFQDTDPLQIDILWLLCAEPQNANEKKPLKRALRPGALFMVGDPKQAIYQFRGADVNAYIGARTAIGRQALLEITTNFRSAKPILDFVNDRFKGVLSEAAGQPGFAELSANRKAFRGMRAVVALDIPFNGEKPNAAALRDAEADCVADLSDRLVGNVAVYDDSAPGKQRPCRFGDIALLAPAGTDLWRFEQALEDRGIPVSTQAGKGLFRRQEVHDLIALTRVLADGRDTLALGALLRGPLVGLTEGDLLDIVEGLPPDPHQPDRLQFLDLRTDTAHIKNEAARSVLEILQTLRRRSRSTTPYMLLADGVAALNVRAQLRQRFKGSAERAIANVDLFLEMSRAYDVRGLLAFARDMSANWEEAKRQVEGRPDAEHEAVSLITVHAVKGLEWPIVIPINMTGTPQLETALVHDRRSNSFSVPVLGVAPTAYADLRSRSEQELARERVRLWYVATTRARDLLILPRHSAKLPENSRAQIVDFKLASLNGIGSEIGAGKRITAEPQENVQRRETFTAEAAGVARLRRTIVWQRPSRDEADGASAPPPLPLFENPEDAEQLAEIPEPTIAGSSTRGLILHKLIEEILTGELRDGLPAIEQRTLELLAQLGIEPVADPKDGISPTEISSTVIRTLSLPEIVQLRSQLVPEHTVFGHRTTAEGEVLVSGVADAVAPDGQGGIEAVVDWKSDVNPSPEAIHHYRKQIDEYRRNTGAKRALLVFLTRGRIIEVT